MTIEKICWRQETKEGISCREQADVNKGETDLSIHAKFSLKRAAAFTLASRQGTPDRQRPKYEHAN